MRKVFVDNLPKHTIGKNRGQIDWIHTIGQYIPFTYDGITGELEIVKYDKPNLVTIRYNNDTSAILTYNLLGSAPIGSLIGACNHHSKHRIKVGTIIQDANRHMEITSQFLCKLDNPKYNRKMYGFSCLKCGWKDGRIIETELLRGRGCACCAGAVVVEGINDIPTTASWMVPYFQGGYDEAKLFTACSNKKVYFLCPECGKVKTKLQSISSLYQTRSIGCMCGDGISFPEKFMVSVLNQLGIDYIWHYRPGWLIDSSGGQREFDFKVRNVIIEMDGGLGHGHKTRGLHPLTPEETHAIDVWKDKQAELRGLQVIRVDAQKSESDYLKNNIINQLSHIYSLDNVNWSAATEYATKSLVKDVCLVYETNSMMLKDIAAKFGLSVSTIVNYLKRGNELSWCTYTTQKSREQSRQAVLMSSERMKLKVDVYQNDILVNSYKSIADCIKQGSLDLGITISNGGIYRALKHGSPYKEFEFKYAS